MLPEEVMKFFAHLEPNKEGDVVLRTGAARKVLDPFDYQGFQYRAHTVPSFVDLVQAKSAGTDRCIVFANEKGFHAILDDTIIDRKKDTVTYEFCLSIRAEEWIEILRKGKVFDIKGFSDFLKRREAGEIEFIDELLFAVQNFKYVTNIEGDFSFEDRNNYTYNVKVNEAESTIRVPKTLTVAMELFKDSGFEQEFEIEIEIHRPRDPSEKPGFLLSCPKFDRYLDRAKQYEFDRLPDLLPEYLLVSGSC